MGSVGQVERSSITRAVYRLSAISPGLSQQICDPVPESKINDHACTI